MSFKTTYILFGVLAGMFLLIVLAVWLGPAGTGDSAFILPSMHKKDAVKTDDIDLVEIDRAKPTKEKLVFQRDPNTKKWLLVEPQKLRVDKHTVDRLVNQVYDARRYELVDLTSNLKEWDLDPPLATITLKKGDQEWKLNLGREREGASSGVVYVTSSDDPKEPKAVRRSELELAFRNLSDFRAKDLLTESSLNLQSVKLQKEKNPPIVLEKVAERRWRFKEPANYGLADYEGEAAGTGAPAKGVHDLLDAIEHIRVESDSDFIQDRATDLARYGLEDDRPVGLRIEVTQRPGSMLGGDEKQPPGRSALLIGKKVEPKSGKKPDAFSRDAQRSAKEKKEADKHDDEKHEHKDEEKYYARLEGEATVVAVTAKSLEPVFKVIQNPESLRNRDLVQEDQIETKTDAVNIENANGLIKLRKPQLTWEVISGGSSDRKADDASIRGPAGLLSALQSKHQVEFPDAVKEADMGLAKPEATVSLWIEGLERNPKQELKTPDKKDEKKDDKKEEKKPEEPKLKTDKPTVKLTFGKRDKLGGKDIVYVRREAGDEKALVAAPASVLDKVSQKPLAYLDRTLPFFPLEGDVTKLVIERGGQTFEIEKETKEAKETKDQPGKEPKVPAAPNWKLKKPADLAGRSVDIFAVTGIINDLRLLRATRLESEKASEAELDKFGLKSPQLKATLTVQDKDKKTEEWTYLFGKEDKGEVYAKQGKQDLVFLVSTPVLKPLQSELLDPTIFHLEPSKVTEVRIEGWEKAQGFAVTLDLVRKDVPSWTVKSPPKFDLDDGQVNVFLAELANLRAERFVVRKGVAKPEYELGEKERALLITLTLEGEKVPLTLTIGKLDPNEKAYYAQSSNLPGDVFLLPQALFEKRLIGVKSFSKHPEPAK
jgi:hypothetical protein